jgi:3-dehydroquinate dehydratase-1
LARAKPRICAAIVNNDLEAIKKVESMVDYYEVRIDLIGMEWRSLARRLTRPWIACNRRAREGGKWRGSERERIRELLVALELGASIIDIELATPNLDKIVKELKGKAKCLISYHNMGNTPSPVELKTMVKNQIGAGADICKVITTASTLRDNISVLELIREFPETKVVSFAMGAAGRISRILCPLAGGYFTYASIEAGSESAAGQVTVAELWDIYSLVR